MHEIITVACEVSGKNEQKRVSRNFETCYFEPVKFMKWHIISMMGDEGIIVDIQQVGAHGISSLKYPNITNGAIMPYESIRNLYVSNPRNNTGHFIIRLEVYA